MGCDMVVAKRGMGAGDDMHVLQRGAGGSGCNQFDYKSPGATVSLHGCTGGAWMDCRSCGDRERKQASVVQM